MYALSMWAIWDPVQTTIFIFANKMLMAFQLLGIYHVISVCPVLKQFVNKGKGWYFFKEKKTNKLVDEISLLPLVFFFYFTYLVVLNSIKIKHFKSCLCDRFDDTVKQTIKNINHSWFYCHSLKRHILFSYVRFMKIDNLALNM